MIRDKLTLCLFGISACFVAVAVARLDGEGIVGGDLANEEHEFPYQVSLQIQGQHFCGGALLGNRHVLTAAHCVTKSTNGDWSSTAKYGFDVVAGTQDLDEAASRRSSATKEQVAKIYILNGYKPQKGSNVNDIAVLKLKNPVDLSSRSNKLGKVELPKPQNTYAGEEAVISGFGYDWAMVMSSQQEIGGNSDRHLRWAKADVISNAQCNRYYRRDPVSEEQICASVKQRSDTKGSGVCSGDSGGPLVHGDKTIIGVVSTSPLGCTEKYVPAVYTRVSSFVDFIENAVNGKKTEDMRVLEIIKTSDDYETVEPTTRRPYHRLTTRRPYYDEPSIPSWEKWFGNSFGGFWG